MKFSRYIIGFIAAFWSFTNSALAGFDVSELISDDNSGSFGRLTVSLVFLCITLIGMMVVRLHRNGEWFFSGAPNLTDHKKIVVSADSALIRVNSRFSIEATNIAAQKFLGKGDDLLVGQSLTQIANEFGLSDTDTRAILKMVKTQFRVANYGLTYKDVTCDRNGDQSTFLISSSPILNNRGKVISVGLIGKDLAVQQKMMDKLVGQAERDHLTGLVNRMGFDKFIEKFPEIVRPGSKNVICYMDLDNFKPVNDSAGHAAGDELLKQLADIFRKHARASDFLARIGGDEFVVIFPDCPVERAKLRCNDMINSVSSLRFSWGDKSFVVGVSMGAVEFDSGVTVSGLHDLCKIADDACYMAKKKGRNQLYIHDPSHVTQSVSNMGADNWQDIIRDALDKNKFKLFVQPIIPLGSAEKDGKKRYEVYVRLPYNGRVLRPGSFFPAAERYGLSRSIDRWVVRKTMKRLARLNASMQDCIPREFTINLSAASLLDESFSAFVLEQLGTYGLNASSLCFEVSEADVISNFTHARKLLTKLATIGCSNSLDDFGSGLSALNYIRDLPIHYLKIDGVFVRNIETNQIDAAMIHSLSHMSKAMNLKTIAEFVEDEHTAKLLNRLGVNYAQGYYCGRPLPLERLENVQAAA